MVVVTIVNNNATLWPYLTIKDLPDFPLRMEKKIGPTVAIMKFIVVFVFMVWLNKCDAIIQFFLKMY